MNNNFKIKELTDYFEVQLEDTFLKKIIGRKWFVENYYGQKLYGAWDKEDLEKALIVKEHLSFKKVYDY